MNKDEYQVVEVNKEANAANNIDVILLDNSKDKLIALRLPFR